MTNDNGLPWGSIISALALLVTLGSGLLSVYGSIQLSLRDLQNIQVNLLPGLSERAEENGRKLDGEINRSREFDQELMARHQELQARLRGLERNMANFIKYVAERTKATEEMFMSIDPKLVGPKYQELRERDKLILPQFIPPTERGEP